jgi:hypothetical protein
MVAAYESWFESRSGTTDYYKYFRRWTTFLFMFACTTLHQLAHLFVCYLSLGNHPDQPPTVTYLNYGVGINPRTGKPRFTKESGRWLETELYGGAVVFYRDHQQGPGQVFTNPHWKRSLKFRDMLTAHPQAGIPYIIDQRGIAWRIDPSAIAEFISNPRRKLLWVQLRQIFLLTCDIGYKFPFRVSFEGLSREDRKFYKLECVGSTASGEPLPPSARAMRAMQRISRFYTYSIRIDELRRRPKRPAVILRAAMIR